VRLIKPDSDNASVEFVNKLDGVLTNVSFTKLWIGPEDRAYPKSINVKLMKNGEEYGRYEPDVSNGTMLFSNLPKYDNKGTEGEPVYTLNTYTVQETDAGGNVIKDGGSIVFDSEEYHVKYDMQNGLILNVDAKAGITFSIVKNWYAPTGVKHPAAHFQIHQVAGNGTDVVYNNSTYSTVEGDTRPSVTLNFNLPREDEGGNSYTYYAVEKNVPADYELKTYECAPPNEFNNWIKPADVTITGVKSWDNENKDGAGPDTGITVGLYSRSGADEYTFIDSQETSAAKGWGYTFNVPGGKLPGGKYDPEDGQYVEYVVREMAPGGGNTPLAHDAAVTIGGRLYHVAYPEPQRDTSGDITANIINAMPEGYYYNVAVYYRTVLDGIPSEWLKTTKRELAMGEAGQTVTLADLEGSGAAAQALIGSWAEWGGSEYSLVEDMCVTSVKLERPGQANAAELAYYYERTIEGLGSGNDDDDDNDDNDNNNNNGGGGNGTPPDEGGGDDTTTPPDEGGGGEATTPSDEGGTQTPSTPEEGGGATTPGDEGTGGPALAGDGLIAGAGVLAPPAVPEVPTIEPGLTGATPEAPSATPPLTPAQTEEPGGQPAGNPPIPVTVQEMLDNQTPITGLGRLLQNLADGNVPLAAPSYAAWSLLSLIMSLLGLLISLLYALRYAWRRHRSEEEENEYEMQLYVKYGIEPPKERAQNASILDAKETAGLSGMSCAEEAEDDMKRKWRRRKLTLLLLCVAGVLTGILFLILDDMRLPMTWINNWTPLIGLVFVTHLVMTLTHRRAMRKGKEEEEPREDEYTDIPAM
jgi:hypothetical protein